MAQRDSDPIWKFFTGMLIGIGMTWGYVRFGFQLPGVLEMPAKVTSAAVSMTADTDLEKWNLPREARQRAAAVILGQNPERFIELDNGMDHAILNTMCRLKAVRRAKLARATFDACDTALEQAALRRIYERKFHTTDRTAIKLRLLERTIQEDAFLCGYLAENWPDETINEWSARVLDVYHSELRPPVNEIAGPTDRRLIR